MDGLTGTGASAPPLGIAGGAAASSLAAVPRDR